MLLATAIKDYGDVYEVGYTGIDNEDKVIAYTDKYYTSITSGLNVWQPEDIFTEDWADDDGVGMIIWEINFALGNEYSFKPYALVGERDGENNLVLPAEEVRVTPNANISKQYFTATISVNDGVSAPMSTVVPAGTVLEVPDNLNVPEGYYVAWYDENGCYDFDQGVQEKLVLTAEIYRGISTLEQLRAID